MNDDRMPTPPPPSEHEEALRRLLRAEAARFSPAPGAWERINQRTAAARWRRRIRTGAFASLSAAAAVLVAVVAVASLLGGDDTRVETRPADESAALPPGLDPGAEEPAPGIWPFTTAAEADAHTGDAYDDPVDTAEKFLVNYLGFTRHQMGEFRQGDSRSGEVTATSREDGPITTVLVRQVGRSGRWTVIGATTPNIRLASPTALDEVASPVRIEGRSTAFEGNVVVEIRQDRQTERDGELGLTPLTGGSMGELGPLVGEVPFRKPETAGGAVVAYTDSAEDGAVEEATVVRVRFARAQPVPTDGRIVAYEETNSKGRLVVLSPDGRVERVLTEDTGDDFGGLAVTPDRRTVYFARDRVGRGYEIVAVPFAGGPLERVAAAGRYPAVSTDGERLAYASDADDDQQDELVVRDLRTGKEQRFPDIDPSGGAGEKALPISILNLSWSPDGRAVAYDVHYEDGQGIQLHNITKPGTLTGNSSRVEPKDQSNSYRHPAFNPAGDLTVGIHCCDEPFYGPSGVLDLDPETFRTMGDVTDFGEPIVTGLAYGPDGNLLVVTVAGEIRRLVDGELRLVASGGYTAAG